MARNRTVYHVIPDSSAERWVVSQEREEFRKEFATKAEAVDFAKARARRKQPHR